MGDSAVGKTNMLMRLATGRFDGSCLATIGASHQTVQLPLPSIGTNVKIEFWDLAGQERYRSQAAMYYRGSAAVAVVYDITSMSTFKSARGWLTELKTNIPTADILLLGNKTDLKTHRNVSKEAGLALAEEFQAQFCEVSAKTSDVAEISKAFVMLATKAMQQQLALNAPRERQEAQETSSKKAALKFSLEGFIIDDGKASDVRDVPRYLPFLALASSAMISSADEIEMRRRFRWKPRAAALCPPYLYLFRTEHASMPECTVDLTRSVVTQEGRVVRLQGAPCSLRLPDEHTASLWAKALSQLPISGQGDSSEKNCADLQNDSVDVPGGVAVVSDACEQVLAEPAHSIFLDQDSGKGVRLEVASLPDRATAALLKVVRRHFMGSFQRVLWQSDLDAPMTELLLLEDRDVFGSALTAVLVDRGVGILWITAPGELATSKNASLIGFLQETVTRKLVRHTNAAGAQAVLVRAVLRAHTTLCQRLQVEFNVAVMNAVADALNAQSLLTSLSLKGMALTLRHATAALVPFRYCPTLCELSLRNTRLTAESAAAVLSWLPRVAPQLSRLDLSCNMLGSETGTFTDALMQLLSALPSLQHVDLSGTSLSEAHICKLLEQAATLALPLRHLKLELLRFSDNSVPAARKFLAACCAKDPPDDADGNRIELSLAQNRLTEAGAKMLLQDLTQWQQSRWRVTVDVEANDGGLSPTTVRKLAQNADCCDPEMIVATVNVVATPEQDHAAGGVAAQHDDCASSAKARPELVPGQYVFISYARADADEAPAGMAAVDRLCAALAGAGLPYWRDVDQIGIGRGDGSWGSMIADGIRGAAGMIVCLSQHYFTSDACRTELALFARRVESRTDTSIGRHSRLLVQAGAWDWVVPPEFEWDLGGGLTHQVTDLYSAFDVHVADTVDSVQALLQKAQTHTQADTPSSVDSKSVLSASS